MNFPSGKGLSAVVLMIIVSSFNFEIIFLNLEKTFKQGPKE